MQIVDDDRVTLFLANTLNMRIVPPATTMGILRDGEVVGAVLFNHFEGPDVHVTIAGKGWTKGFCAEVGHYVFDRLGCVRMTAVTEQVPVVRIAERLGGKVEGLMRNHFGPSRDAYIVGILKDEYRF